MNFIDRLGEWSLHVLTFILLVIAPIQTTLIAVFGLCLLDFITGIWASKKKGIPITSAGMKKTFSKFVIYEIAVISAFSIETYFLPDAPLIKSVTAMIGLIEAKSLFENIHAISGIDFIAEALKKVHAATTNKDVDPK